VVSSVDTGGTQDSLVLLTPAIVTPYAATEKALAAYWAAHPDQAKQARDHGHAMNFSMTNKGQTTVQSLTVPDYPMVVQHDTAVAAIFTNAQLSPALFEPIERSVQRAVAAVILQQQAADSTVMGQNMAFVRAHRPELAVDWSTVQSEIQISQNVMQQIMQNVHQRLQNQNGRGSDLQP
jgi:hypothetical protein